MKNLLVIQMGLIIIFGISIISISAQQNYDIPSWVKGVAGFWAEGKITDNEFGEGISFLISSNIIKIPEIESLQNQILVLENENKNLKGELDFLEKENTKLRSKTTSTLTSSQDCFGNARCFTGSVNQVTDGDTITVSGKSIRFALSSAPELNEFGGQQAREFIVNLCPVGSTALVDEDDGQTEGSYGRIIGLIHCNGYNLNAELLDSGNGYLASGFCDQSEFASHSWVQKYGCFIKHQSIPQATQTIEKQCDSAYPDFCIPSPPPDLDCKDIQQKRFTVLPPDPHKFDGDKDGIGCES